MTSDKASYTIEFANQVSTGAVTTIRDAAEPDVLTVEVETDDNIAEVTVWGDGNAIPVWEEQMKHELFDSYPSAEIVNVDVQVGEGQENSPDA